MTIGVQVTPRQESRIVTIEEYFPMYDTIKILGHGNVFYDAEQMFWQKDWEQIERETSRLEDFWVGGPEGKIKAVHNQKAIMWKHKGTDLRVMGTRMTGMSDLSQAEGNDDLAVMKSVEFALPKQIYETNGSLITNQLHMEEALSRAMGLVQQVCPEWESTHISRLDLVWHFSFDPYRTMQEIKRLRHPRIRKATTEYNEDESLIFRGTERKLRVYDKLKEMVNRKGHVTRVELQLNGRSLVNDFEDVQSSSTKAVSIGADIPPSSQHKGEEVVVHDRRLKKLPSFDSAYSVYRDFLHQMEPVRTPKFSKIYDLLAHLNHDGTQFNSTGQSVVDAYLMNLAPASRSRVRREIRKHKINWNEFSFRSLLGNKPPKPLHIHREQREVLFEESPQRRNEHPQSTWSGARHIPGLKAFGPPLVQAGSK